MSRYSDWTDYSYGTFDDFGRQRWIFLITGFADSNSRLYKIYRCLILLLNFSILSMSLYAAYLGWPNLNMVIEAVHLAAGVICTSGGLVSRLVTQPCIRRMMEMVRRGLDQYELEARDEEISGMKRLIGKEISRKILFIEATYFLSFMSNMVYFPLCKYYFLPDMPKGDINFYLPHLLYFPFDTTTPIGYSCAYMVDFIFFFFLYMTAVNMISMYVFSTVQLKVHIRMLNLSLGRINERARRLHPLMRRQTLDECFYECFRSNIRHHQALLRFKKESQPFIGIILLITFTLAALVYATVLYLIFQMPPVFVLVHLAITNIAEQIYVLYIGVFGEQIIQESNKLFVELYNIQWYTFDERAKKCVALMQTNCSQPMILKATLLGTSASIESYGSLLATMYKLMNVARQWAN